MQFTVRKHIDFHMCSTKNDVLEMTTPNSKNLLITATHDNALKTKNP